ncbi:glycerophosphodiester phosphodiesterase [Haladaptatus sp. DYF46]|uniref:glycerophosphodiester phosphodiesterase n=1 Tax=Haladaptatus sp. DYF46 TaxID=2886041 RepID=UPI001E2A32DA|nr:glycerophosphodiester phosphodiesterase [Haladaptatus sp. DYF46]
MPTDRIAHRGFADDYPENTPLAFRTAAEHADAVEMDVQRCGSGELVVFHDAKLGRVTDRFGLVQDTPWSVLWGLTILDSDETVPSLETALGSVPAGTAINLELKHVGMADEVLDAVEDVENEILLSSFDSNVLRDLRERDDDVRLAYINQRGPNCIDTAVDLDCVCVHPRADLCDAAFVERAHQEGLRVNSWTVDDEEGAAALADAGVDGIVSDTSAVF